MAGIDYKAAYEALIHTIQQERELWTQEAERFEKRAFQDLMAHNYVTMRADESLQERYEAKADQCEYLLKQAAEFVGVSHEIVNENGRISLHLIDRANDTCVYDLDCNVGEMPKRVWCEYYYNPTSFGYVISTQYDHMHNVREYGEIGMLLTAVWPSCSFRWENDRGQVVDGPKVWAARYTDPVILNLPLSYR